jgi:hypothetical protein
MAIFEAIAGRSTYLTYFIDETDARLFLVEDDRIRPIIPDFETTIGLLQLYAGADNLREHQTYQNWRDRIGADEMLQRVDPEDDPPRGYRLPLPQPPIDTVAISNQVLRRARAGPSLIQSWLEAGVQLLSGLTRRSDESREPHSRAATGESRPRRP